MSVSHRWRADWTGGLGGSLVGESDDSCVAVPLEGVFPLTFLRQDVEPCGGLVVSGKLAGLDQLFAAHPILQTLHEEMHRLRELINHKHQSKKQCREHTGRLLATIRHLRENQAAPLQTLANTLDDWIEPIACMWRFARNNGIT